MKGKVKKTARKLVEKDFAASRDPEDLAAYDYRKFVVNSDTHNDSKIITVEIMKVSLLNVFI